MDDQRFTVDEVLASLAVLGVPNEVQDRLRGMLHQMKQLPRDGSLQERACDAAGHPRTVAKDRKPGSLTSSHSTVSEDFDPMGRGDSSNSVLHSTRGQHDGKNPSAEHAGLPQGTLPSSHSPPPARSRHAAEAVVEDDQYVIKMPCMRCTVGRVIGKSGDTIKALQQYTKTSIQIDQSTDPTLVTVSGSTHSVRTAAAMIADIIDGRFKGFAMLRQLSRADNAVPGSQQASLGVIEGIIPNVSSDYSQSAKTDPNVANVLSGNVVSWKPTYVQGYGFLPPPTSVGQTHATPSFSGGAFDTERGGHNFASSFHKDGGSHYGLTTAERGISEKSLPPLSEHCPESALAANASGVSEKPHQALLSRLALGPLGQQASFRSQAQDQQAVLGHQREAYDETKQEILRALMQLRLKHEQATSPFRGGGASGASGASGW